MKLTKSIEFNNKKYIFIRTSTEEQYQHIIEILEDNGMTISDERYRNQWDIYGSTSLIYIHQFLNFGRFYLEGYERDWKGCLLFSYDEFLSEYTLSLSAMVDRLDENIAKMEERMHSEKI